MSRDTGSPSRGRTPWHGRPGCRFMLAVLVLLALVAVFIARVIPHGPPLGSMPVRLIRVSDGDTIVVRRLGMGGVAVGEPIHVRLCGIDTPELGSASGFRSALFAAELLEHARSLKLEVEPRTPRDKYGRTLGWLWVYTPERRELLLQEELVKGGHAALYPDAKGSKYWDRLVRAQ